jgi:hypothetical protein
LANPKPRVYYSRHKEAVAWAGNFGNCFTPFKGSTIMPQFNEKQLNHKKLRTLKTIASQLGITPKGDKRYKATWVTAILNHQPQLTLLPVKPEAMLVNDGDSFEPWVIIVDGAEVERFSHYMMAYKFALKSYTMTNENDQCNFTAIAA